jgi:sucrose phosphorylase
MDGTQRQAIVEDLIFIYDRHTAEEVLPKLETTVNKLRECCSQRNTSIDQEDAVLITYGDTIRTDDDRTPLQGLKDFIHEFIKDAVDTIHILPFYPYSSDDGFSVLDYRKVDPALGSWNDIREIGKEHNLMFDLVANHVSRSSSWFQSCVSGDPYFENYFIEVDPKTDLSSVFRPRALPLLTAVETVNGMKHFWTTFSEDQIDLNYAHPEVLLKMVDILSDYISNGASIIRLDAVAFIWKEIGTSCIHHPKTHRIVKLIRKLLDYSASGARLITETNVPHRENISYFGNGHDEASMVYNFPLPPLTLHAFMCSDASALSSWAARLEFPSDDVTYFNFLASHDGIGLMPLHGLLHDHDVEFMAQRIKELGGYVSFKSNSDGTKSPYEMNMNYFEALGVAGKTEHEVERFIASQSIMLALRGVPGIYLHSLIGSGNWTDGPKMTGMHRSINREKLLLDDISDTLRHPESRQYRILSAYRRLLLIRKKEGSFSPKADQQIIQLSDPAIFCVLRIHPDGREAVLCLTNISDKVSFPVDTRKIFNREFSCEHIQSLTTDVIKQNLSPYEVLWIKGTRGHE